MEIPRLHYPWKNYGSGDRLVTLFRSDSLSLGFFAQYLDVATGREGVVPLRRVPFDEVRAWVEGDGVDPERWGAIL